MISRDQQSSIKARLDKIEDSATLTVERAEKLCSIQQDILKAVNELREKENSPNHRVSSSADNNEESISPALKVHESFDQSDEQVKPFLQVRDLLLTLQSMITSLPRENWILKNLHFDSLHKREDNISNAEEGTFEWILRDESEDDSHTMSSHDNIVDEPEMERRARSRELFLLWLRDGNQAFHISGKAGSGKSTLMRYLCLNPKTKEALELWSGDKKLALAHFFFWNSGDDLQMSLQGLYRSLLFEILKQCPELIPDVFPNQWKRISAGEVDVFESAELFRWPMIKDAFRILVARAAYARHRFCFFIDGLDEYSGSGVDSIAHQELANSLKMWASNDDIKICVSSRPHREFMNAFSDSPGIRLHELTRHDIRVFSRQKFERNVNFDSIKGNYQDLVDKVVEKSEGVFLWARLAVHSLLISVGRHDPPSVLEEQLDAIPADLDALYDGLLNSIPPQDRQKSNRMLLVTILNPFANPLNAIVYTWLDDLEKDPQFPRAHTKHGYSKQEIEKRFQDVQHQLDGYTRGMLEMVDDGKFGGHVFGVTRRVEFLHRTLRDYLLSEPRRSRIVDQFPNFNPIEAFARLRLAEVTLLVPEYDALARKSLGGGPGHHVLVAQYTDFLIEPLEILKFNGSRQLELPLDLLERFSHVVRSRQVLAVELRDFATKRSSMAKISPDALSFLHLAAYRSQFSYIISKVSKNRELLKSGNDLSLLLSAVFGGSPDFVLTLLNMGACPNDKFELPIHGNQTTVCDALSRELITSLCSRGCYTYVPPDRDQIIRLCVILEYFLQRGMSSEYYFRIYRHSNRDGDALSNVISLNDLVRMLNPPNLNTLLHLLEPKKTNSIIDHAKRILSNLVPWVGSEPISVRTRGEHVELQPDDTHEFTLQATYLGDVELPRYYCLRLY